MYSQSTKSIFEDLQIKFNMPFYEPAVCFLNNKLISENKTLLNKISTYLNDEFRITAFIESKKSSSTYLHSMQYDIDDQEFYMSEDIFIYDGKVCKSAKVNLTDIKTNAILLKIGSSNYIKIAHIFIKNGNETLHYKMEFKKMKNECEREIGILVKNDIGWKFYPCQNSFV